MSSDIGSVPDPKKVKEECHTLNARISEAHLIVRTQMGAHGPTFSSQDKLEFSTIQDM